MLQLCISTLELGVGLDKGIFNGRARICNVWLASKLSLSLLDNDVYSEEVSMAALFLNGNALL